MCTSSMIKTKKKRNRCIHKAFSPHHRNENHAVSAIVSSSLKNQKKTKNKEKMLITKTTDLLFVHLVFSLFTFIH